jgi:tetratricopeptide (TPR) repeat protein
MKIATLLCLLFNVAPAQTLHDAFEKGNQLYRDGRFEEAIQEYEEIIRQGYASAALFHNLGNSYYRLGKISPAILAYERAIRLAPNDPDIQHNLSLAHLRATDRIEPLPELFFVPWLRTVGSLASRSTTLQLFGIAWLLLFLSLSVFFLSTKDTLLRLLRLVAATSFLFVLLFGVLLFIQVALLESQDAAIITAPVVTVKSSPDPKSVDAFVIHEGLKVRIDDGVGEWRRISLADGKVGWIRSTELEQI